MLRQPISPIAPFFRVPRKVDRARNRAPRRLLLPHSNQIQYRNSQTHTGLDESTIESIHACESSSPEGIDIGGSIPSWPAEEDAFIEVALKTIFVDRGPRPEKGEIGTEKPCLR